MEIQVSSSAPTPKTVEAIAATFAALGQPSRLRIVRLLLAAYPDGLPAGEIQQELGIAPATLSHHLDKLRQVGVVESTKDRQWIRYSVRSDTLGQLMAFLYEECCTRNSVLVLEDGELRPACCDDPGGV
ncbi:metalloregulator ArsR/SmtB family transcription factor [Nodosilinea sp. P-1105]|uniref:ArsR/SmtB family transcription factor n=1 Tax=Nodosilinea sp. P-1105 TaxID=2546229 RepID=UPI00146A93EF|nr:metalloregulator ArsR/SmtB family transcription factor [Nodosilinea sp. P-1105]NMF85490.1 ArsR family transcriptional regulator [Nodosilinea sp. P-1105]